MSLSNTAMTRLFVVGGAFGAVTLGLVLLQAGSSKFDAPAKEAASVQPAPVPALAPANDGETVTRQLTDLTELALAATAEPSLDIFTPASDDDALRALAAIKKISIGTATAPEDPGARALRALTSSLVADLSGGTGTQQQAQHSIEDIILHAMEAGHSTADIDVLLNEAHAGGHVHVPEALQTSEGRVDTATLLSHIVARAAPEAKVEPVLLHEAEGIETEQHAGLGTETHYYTVKRGDSLGAIAQRFYGDANFFTTIFQANRANLASPNSVRVGQRLVIPALGSS